MDRGDPVEPTVLMALVVCFAVHVRIIGYHSSRGGVGLGSCIRKIVFISPEKKKKKKMCKRYSLEAPGQGT